MKNDSISENIKSSRFYLNKIVANRIKEEPVKKRYNILQKVYYEILKKEKDNITIKVITETFVEPDELFHIKLEHIVDYMLKKEMSDIEVKENINKLLSPLGPEVSYIVSSITKKMLGVHLVLPPHLKIEK